MYLELKRESKTASGSIPGKLYLNGVFFGYTLENSEYSIPAGTFYLYERFSPKFLTNKIAIEVPNRQYILFHGGNTKEDSTGCVLVAKNRISKDFIQGDLSESLRAVLSPELEHGTIKIKVTDSINFFKVGAVLAALYILTR